MLAQSGLSGSVLRFPTTGPGFKARSGQGLGLWRPESILDYLPGYNFISLIVVFVHDRRKLIIMYSRRSGMLYEYPTRVEGWLNTIDGNVNLFMLLLTITTLFSRPPIRLAEEGRMPFQLRNMCLPCETNRTATIVGNACQLME
ncbi:hypothetical protein TNCV_4038981 [Trichonephila clavipes]|nr:hypothetical protein TNCV_4038981 [Trichonephila clavipes]